MRITNKKLFIAGTDTGVGKTLVAAMLVAGMTKGVYWKPIQCGTEHGTDTQWVRRITGLPMDRFFREAHCLPHPLSPHAAARKAGIRIGLNDFNPPPDPEGSLVVEGTGGVMVPINEKYMMLDLMKKLSLPVLLVARSILGTINHTLLSLEAIRRHHLHVIGVVLNGKRNPSNKQAIEYYGRTRVLLEIDPLGAIDKDILANYFNVMEWA